MGATGLAAYSSSSSDVDAIRTLGRVSAERVYFSNLAIMATATEDSVLSSASSQALSATSAIKSIIKASEYLQGRKPSVPGNLVFFLLMCFFFAFHIFYGFYTKQRWFGISWSCGLILELLGYLARLLLHYNMTSYSLYMLQMTGLTIAPCFIMAGIYYLLAQMTIIVSPALSVFRPSQYTYVFIGADIISILVQAAGGGITTDPNNWETGKAMLIAGLVFQVVSMTFFQFCWYLFWYRWRRELRDHGESGLEPKYKSVRARRIFKLYPYAVSLAVIFIYVRSIYRIAELCDGFQSDLATHEAYFFPLEASMMTLSFILLTFLHPGTAYGRGVLVKVDHGSMKSVFGRRKKSDQKMYEME
ncbi:hypothetical protein KL914_000247 [Ogataea haglerorum]|nr:hypothetical protein KL914_000247 [Ogataea haglerorum]KAG7742900.1 hypothetical protein KL923_000515 [Ogataea haglerorum]